MSLLSSSSQVSRNVFNKHSHLYDKCFIVNGYLGKWDSIILNMNLAGPLLDLGCGPGRFLNKFLQSGRSDIVGFDISHEGLKIARGKSRSAGDALSAKAHFAEGLIEELPFSGNRFKTVILSGVLHHLENADVVLREIARVMAPSGKLVIAEPYFPPVIRSLINAVLAIYPLTGDRRFYSPKSIIKKARDAGFQKKDLVPMRLSYILVFELCCN